MVVLGAPVVPVVAGAAGCWPAGITIVLPFIFGAGGGVNCPDAVVAVLPSGLVVVLVVLLVVVPSGLVVVVALVVVEAGAVDVALGAGATMVPDVVEASAVVVGATAGAD